jgi:hypothetical protein
MGAAQNAGSVERGRQLTVAQRYWVAAAHLLGCFLFDKSSSVVVAIFEADEKNAAASKDVLAARGPPESKQDKLLWAQGDTAC